MELKFSRKVAKAIEEMCSNRTFMELKWRTVLYTYLLVSSNRTFMELKYVSGCEYAGDDASSNRTFMELK